MHNFLIMFSLSVFYGTADLPVNVLALIDQQFYSFVQERLGECQPALLKIRQINSVPCFLVTDDPCQVLNLNIDDNEVKILRKQICFLLSDGSVVVKPGVKNGFKCLRDILRKKTEEKLKQTRLMKGQSAPSPSTDRSSWPVPNSSAVLPTSSNTSTPQLIAASSADRITMACVMHRRKYFLNLLEQWFSDYHPCTFFHDPKRPLAALQLRLKRIGKNAFLCLQNETFAAAKCKYEPRSNAFRIANASKRVTNNSKIRIEFHSKSHFSIVGLSWEDCSCLNLRILRFFLIKYLLSQVCRCRD